MPASEEELHAEIARLCAEISARLQWRPGDREMARWRAMDVLPVIGVRLVRAEHVCRRREALAVALAGWRAWMAVLREQVLGEVWRGVLMSWSLWSGRAPPVEAITGTVQRK